MERSRLWLFLLSHRDISLLQTLVGFVAILPWTFAAEMMKNRIENVARVEMLAAVEAILKSGTRLAGTKLSSFGFDKKFLRLLSKLKSHWTTSSPLRETCSVVWYFVHCGRESHWSEFLQNGQKVFLSNVQQLESAQGLEFVKFRFDWKTDFTTKMRRPFLAKVEQTLICVRASSSDGKKHLSLSLSLSLWSVYLRERARVLCRELWERESGAVVGFTEAQRWVDFTPFPQQFPQLGSPSPSLTHPPLSHTVGNFCQRAANTGCSQKMRERERVCGYIEERERKRKRSCKLATSLSSWMFL